MSVYLGEPEEVLHEGAGAGIFNFYDGNLVLWRYQHVVVSVEDGRQVEASGGEHTHTHTRVETGTRCYLSLMEGLDV